MKRSGSKSAFDEAVKFAKDKRPYHVKEQEYIDRINSKRMDFKCDDIPFDEFMVKTYTKSNHGK